MLAVVGMELWKEAREAVSMDDEVGDVPYVGSALARPLAR